MKNQDLMISPKLVWLLIGGNFFIVFLGAFAKLQGWEMSQFLLVAGVSLFFSTWVIVLGDMIKNKIYQKTFWIIFMFIFPLLSAIFYMIQRDRLIRLGQKLS